MSVPPGLMNTRTGPRLVNIALMAITGFWVLCGWLLAYVGPTRFLVMAAAWMLGYKTLWRLPSSKEQLTKAETELLMTLKSSNINYEKRSTTISRGRSINAALFTRYGDQSGEDDRKILLCIHGLGAGLGVWVKNIPHLIHKYDIWCIDLLGFGLSSKEAFSGRTPSDAAEWWITSIKEWRDANIENDKKVDLLGHSLGGFVGASYALKYPDDVEQLLLAAPVGIISSKDTIDRMSSSTRLGLRLAFLIGMSRSRMVALLGPFALSVIQKVIVKRKRWYGFDEGPLSTYMCHLQCAPVTGELPLRCLVHPRQGWQAPLIKQLCSLSTTSKVSVILGKNDFTNSDTLLAQISESPSPSIQTFVLDNVGHHMYATHPEEFAKIILSL